MKQKKTSNKLLLIMFCVLVIMFLFQLYISKNYQNIYATNSEDSTYLATSGPTGIVTSAPTLTPTGVGGSGPSVTPTPTGVGGSGPSLTPSPTISIGPSFPTPTVTATPTLTPTPDTQAPTVAITNPQNGARVNRNTTVVISATAADNVAVSSVKFSVNGSLLCTDTTSQYQCAWSVPKKANVTYTLSAQAIDTSGNSATANITVKSR